MIKIFRKSTKTQSKKRKIKKRFRIVTFKNERNVILYQAQMKNIFWKSFYCSDKGEMEYGFEPVPLIFEEESIDNYRKKMKWKKNEIQIEILKKDD